MNRTNFKNKKNINKNHIKYTDKVYYNNDGTKTIQTHDKFIIDAEEQLYDEYWTILKYSNNVMIYCCEYESINGGKIRKTYEEMDGHMIKTKKVRG